MADDLGSFAARIRRLGARVESNCHEVAKRAALAVDQAVVLATPVDTGRARANWRVSIGTPLLSATDDTDPSGQAAIDQGRRVIDGFPGGETQIYIANNLPYIGRLNEGYSSQAPANFVELSVDAGLQVIRGSTVVR